MFALYGKLDFYYVIEHCVLSLIKECCILNEVYAGTRC